MPHSEPESRSEDEMRLNIIRDLVKGKSENQPRDEISKDEEEKTKSRSLEEDGDLERRVISIESQMKHFATKAFALTTQSGITIILLILFGLMIRMIKSE